MAESVQRPAGTPVAGISAGAFPRTEIVAAVTGTSQTITVPSGALFCTLKCATAAKFRGANASGANYDLAADTELNNIPVSGAIALYLYEDSGSAGVGATQVIWEMGENNTEV